MSADPYRERESALLASLRSLGDVAIAFSGGVDSSVLLIAAREALGERAVALIADSPSLARAELAEALEFARKLGCEPIVVATDELEDPRYRANAGDRCYYCKATLFRAMASWARERGFAHLAFGEIVDDLVDDRPGARAAREFHVHAPLSQSGFTKEDVRRFARERNLAVSEKPSSACLASRLPVGTAVTRERLARIEAAETAMKALGFMQVRVRDRGDVAGFETSAAEFQRARDMEAKLALALAPLGFARVELAVYRTAAERLASS